MSSIWMTEGEICASYRQAKDPKEQIRVLSELNLCTGVEIKEILRKHGELPAKKEKAAIAPEKERKKQMNGRKWTLEEVEYMLEKKKAGVPLGDIAADLGRPKASISTKLKMLKREGMKIAEELAAEEAKAEPEKTITVSDGAKHISVAEKLLAGYKSLMSLSDLEDEIIIEIKRDRVQMHAVCDGCIVTITFEGDKA